MNNNYVSILSQCQRDSGYVNATKMCKAFGKRLDVWKKAEQTKEFIKVLESFTPNGVKVIRSVRGSGTFVHPILAIHLAEWLSPEFSVFVKKEFKQFLDADPELTKNLISRTEDIKAVEEIQEKTEIQRQYLRSEFCLNYEGDIIEDELNAPWLTPVVKSYNNDTTNTRDGDRPSMADNDKATLTFIQLAQAKKWERTRKSENPYLKAGEAKDDAYIIAKQSHELMYGTDAPKPRDWNKMKPDSKQKFLN